MIGFVLILVGSALIWNYSDTDNQNYILTQSRASLRYNACYFTFIWLSSTVTALFQRPNLVAINAGFLAALITFSMSFESLDRVRIILNVLNDLPSGAPGVSDRIEELRKLAAGGVIAYVGAGLSFIASVMAFQIKKQPQSTLRLLVISLIVLFTFIGSIIIWQSQDVQYGGKFRELLFEATESSISVVLIFVVGVFYGMGDLVNVAAAVSTFYNFSILNSYLEIKGNLLEEHNDGAGCVLLWLSSVAMVFFCAMYHSTSYLSLDSDA